jgi:hypothetical protein
VTTTGERARSDCSVQNCNGMSKQCSPEKELQPMNTAKHAKSQDIQILKSESNGRIIGLLNSDDTMKSKGRHIMNMGLKHGLVRPVTGYNPTPGLVSLFHKTGKQRRNPNLQSRAHVPPNQPSLPRRSYAETTHFGMEGNGVPMQGSGYGNVSGGYRGSQAEAFARGRFQ